MTDFRRRIVAALALVLGAVVLVVLFTSGLKQAAALVAVVGGLLAALVSLLNLPGRFSLSPAVSSPAQVEAAINRLAQVLTEQAEEEAKRWRRPEDDQMPMPIRWRKDDGGRFRPGRRKKRGRGRDLPASGDLAELVDAFAKQPRSLVIVGDPGSGKTALCNRLTLAILQKKPPLQVPVPLQVSGWDPRRELGDWLGGRLQQRYDFLGPGPTYGRTAIKGMVENNLILPILDGLDELPDEARTRAADRLHRHSSSRPFVVTCRSEEFRALEGHDLAKSVEVVRLQPLAPEAAADYLATIAGARAAAWTPVLERMRARPDDLLTRVLSRPLNVFLAERVYHFDDSDPRELITLAEGGDFAVVERHLIDEFISVVFDPRFRTRTLRRWPRRSAERWLEDLAHYLSTTGTRDLVWWRLRNRVPRPALLAISGGWGAIVCGLLGLVLLGLYDRPLLGTLVGATIGLIGGLAFTVFEPDEPRRTVPRWPTRADFATRARQDIAFGLTGFVVSVVAVGLIFDVRQGAAAGFLLGIVFGLVSRLSQPTEKKLATSPQAVLDQDRKAVGFAALVGGTVAGVIGGYLGGVLDAREHGLIVPVENPLLQALLGAAGGALLGAAGLGMLVQTSSAWGRLIDARLWLAFKGYAPLRLMAFLDYGHEVGVLRAVGPYYQFRHPSLQDRLAERRAQRDVVG